MAKQRKTSQRELVVVQFLLPKYDRGGAPYPRTVHQDIRQHLEDTFGGWSSLGDQPLPGAWRNPESGHVEYDESWRYEVGIAPGRLDELDDYLADLARRTGQKAIWRVVYEGGGGKAILARGEQA